MVCRKVPLDSRQSLNDHVLESEIPKAAMCPRCPWSSAFPWAQKRCCAAPRGCKIQASDTMHSRWALAAPSQPVVSDAQGAFLSLWDSATFLLAFFSFPGGFLQALVLWTFHSGSSSTESHERQGRLSEEFRPVLWFGLSHNIADKLDGGFWW